MSRSFQYALLLCLCACSFSSRNKESDLSMNQSVPDSITQKDDQSSTHYIKEPIKHDDTSTITVDDTLISLDDNDIKNNDTLPIDDISHDNCLKLNTCDEFPSCTSNLETCEFGHAPCLSCKNDIASSEYLSCANFEAIQLCSCASNTNSGNFFDILLTWKRDWEFTPTECLTETFITNKIETDGGHFECKIDNNGISYLEPVVPANVTIPPYTYTPELIQNLSNTPYFGFEIRFQYFNFTSNPSNAYGLYRAGTFDEKISELGGNASFLVTGKYLPLKFADDIAIDFDTGTLPLHRIQIMKVGAHTEDTITNPSLPLPWIIVRHALDLHLHEIHTWVWKDNKNIPLYYLIHTMNPEYNPNGLMIGINDKREEPTTWSLARIDYIERFTWTPACVNP